MAAHILIIEDNAANLQLAEYLLKAAGHRISSATNGADGVHVARREPPDLVVCDLQMPGLDGYQVLAELRADPVLQRIPVVAVTAFSMPGDRDRAMSAGFTGYLSKPIDPQTFISEIEAYLPLGKRGHRPGNR